MKWRSATSVLYLTKWQVSSIEQQMYGSEHRAYKVQHMHNMSAVEMWMLRWMSSNPIINNIRNDHVYQCAPNTHWEKNE